MDVKEKLMEILRNPIFPHELADPVEAVADYLIDSGVTVQEWISVKDRLPEDDEVVLVTFYDGCDTYSSTDFIVKNEGWHNNKGAYEVTHWQYMPQPPKGENE